MKLFQKKTTKLFLILALCIAMFTCFVACDPADPSPSPSTSAEADKTLISNGYFDKTSGTTLPKTPTNWTGAAGTGNGGSANITSDYSIRGVVNAGAVGSVDNTLPDPGKANDDDNGTGLLMIWNKTATAFRYRSASFSVAKNATVEISVDVWTQLTSGAAKIVITDGKAPYYEFTNIDTDGEWATYTFTLQGNQVATKYVYVELWLGEGGKDDTTTHAQGVAYFDNVTAYKVDMDDAEFDELATDADTQKYSLRLLNFDFARQHASGSKKNYATDWNTLSGGSTSKKVDGVTKSVSRGIYDANTAFTLSDSSSFTPGESEGTDGKILGIESPFKSAIGYKSSALYVGANSYYKLSVWVKTADVDGSGAYISLTDVANTEFAAIDTDGDWVQYNYYIKGSATQNKSIQLELWLGSGSSSDTDDFTAGYAFFDSVTYEEIDESEMLNDGEEDAHNILVDELWSANLITTAPAFGDFEYVENHGTPNTPGVNQIAGVVSTTATLSDYDLVEPIGGIDRADEDDTAYMLYHKDAGATKVALTDASTFTILPNHNYRLSFWVRTIGVAEGKGLVSILTDATDSSDVTDLSTLTAINTECFEEDCEEEHDAWNEVTFYIKGDVDEVKNVSLRFTLGSGNSENPDTYVSGHVFISNFYLESVSASEYSSATASGNLGKYTFWTSTSSSTTIANGGFDNFDVKESVLVDGQLTNVPGVVDAWTSTKTNTNTVAGITNKKVFDNVKANNSDFPAIDFPYDASIPAIFNGQPNLLMIWNKTDAAYNYTSPSLSLNSNSYYRITAQVKTEYVTTAGVADGAFAYVSLQTGDNDWVIPVNTNDVADNDGWVTVEFYVSNGFTSTSIEMVLGLGDNLTGAASGVAFFDNVIMTTSTEEEFNEAVESDYVKVINLTAETFDTSAIGYPAAPSNYTGTVGKNSPSGSSYVMAGIINLEDTEALQEYYEDSELNPILSAFGGNHSAPYILMIHNRQDTAYSYTRDAVSLAMGNTYLIKVKAITTGLNTGDSGKITVDLGNDQIISIPVNVAEWTEFSFYITTNSTKAASASITFTLGEGGESTSDSTNWVTGAIAFDDLVIEKIDADDIPDTESSLTHRTYTIPEEETEDDDDDDDTATEIDWGKIIEIIVASLLSIVVVVVLVWALVKKMAPYVKAKKTKKFARPNKDVKKKKVVAPEENNDEEFND